MTGKLLFRDTSIADRNRFYSILSVVIILLLTWLAISLWPIAFPMDDAYITIHNARALLSGVDRNYGVPALVGATSPVHLLLVAAMMQLAPPLLASFLVSGAAILLYGLGLARLTFQFGGSAFLASLIVLLGTLTGYAPYQLLNGLETGLAMAAVIWALVFAIMPAPLWALPLLCGVLPFIRPELGALSCILMGRHCWILRKDTPAILRSCLIFISAALPWLLWQWVNTGAIIPSTASAKRFFFSEGGLPASLKLRMILGGILMSGLAPLIGVWLFVPRSILACCVIIFSFIVILALYLVFPGGAGQNYSRYLFILLPPLLWGVIGIVKHERRGISILAILLCAMLASIPLSWFEYKNGVRFMKTETSSTAQWAIAHLPVDAKILVHDAGYISFATSFRLIDLVGLKTPENIEYFRKMPHTEAVGLVAQRFKPKYAIILRDRDHYWSRVEDDLRAAGWSLRILHASANIPGYSIYELIPQSGISELQVK